MHVSHQVRLEKEETQHDETAGGHPSKNQSCIQMRKTERIIKSGMLNVEHNKVV